VPLQVASGNYSRLVTRRAVAAVRLKDTLSGQRFGAKAGAKSLVCNGFVGTGIDAGSRCVRTE